MLNAAHKLLGYSQFVVQVSHQLPLGLATGPLGGIGVGPKDLLVGRSERKMTDCS